MIRINLLAQKKRAERAEGSQLWLVVVMVVVLAEVAALFVLHSFKAQELADQERTNAELSSQIDQVRKNVANHEQVKAELALLR
ncbi:MAG TPA: hypothetical protein VEQ59_25235, partial [Polyangiaceae bacterium]|nr:hypothetical protein [Polyangiaceae bacterium]